jgi:predicted O-linked N-acetylglucosamine transferase (SPINDLY family)
MLSPWQEQLITQLEAEEYDQLIQWSEQAIENSEHGSLPYWYLGLGYLLKGQIEEAQGIWLSGWFEAPGEATSDARTEQLADILEQEAERQATKHNFSTSVQIREQLQEIQPENINNSLRLIQILLNNQRFSPGLLTDWEFLPRLEATPLQAIDEPLLLQVLRLILEQFSGFDKANLVKISYSKINDKTEFLKSLIASGLKLAYSYSRFDLAIEIMKLCQQIQPGSRLTLKHLTQIYSDSHHYRKGIEIAIQLAQNSTNLPEKIEANCLLLRAYLSAGAWSEISQIIEENNNILEELAQSSLHQFPDKSFIPMLPLTGLYLSYIEDAASSNRFFQNQTAQIFQNTVLDNQQHIIKSFKNRQSQKTFLRIGYIASTLRCHSVGWLARWLIQNHNRKNIHVSVYLIDHQPDHLTTNLQQTVDHFRLLDQSILDNAQTIANDDIDILVDLDSCTYTKTCQVLSYKPAPIQVTWLGWDASGLPAIDYYLADPYVLPDNAQEYYQETIWRLPHSYVAVQGFESDVPTLTRQGLNIPTDATVYFSSQNALKRHPDTVRLQMRILKQVPNSYLLIKGKSDEDLIQNFFQTIASEEGVDPQRLRFLDRDPNEYIHRANLGIADVVLDTYPYNGATTTLETLWMGIPLVTKVGQQFVARNSYTFLKNVGVEEGIAWTDEEYVEWGVKLGTDENLRRDVHWKLLQSRKTSPLWDVEQFVTDMETAYQQMWAKYVEQVKTYPVVNDTIKPEAERDQSKPTLRILHNLPRCGGTLISKCLATMDNNLLLSEIHPRGMETFHPAQQADQWFNLLSPKDLNDLASKPIPFIDVIRLIHQRSQERDCNLIIRDWAHLDFFGVPWTNNLSYRLDTAEELTRKFNLLQVAIVRHPVDQWLSLNRLSTLQGKLTLENFLKGYLEFAKIASEIGFIRYEDFTHHPDFQLKTLCDQLNITFDSEYKGKWKDYKKITGEIASKGEIVPQPRRQIKPETLQEIQNNQLYLEAITLLGYEDLK